MRLLPIVFVCACAAGQQPKLDPVTALVQRIEGLATAEPPVFGLDTRIRAAEIIAASRPALARKLLDTPVPLLAAISDDDSRATFLASIVRHMASVDLVEAEKLAATMPPAGERDYMAVAYDTIIRVRPADAAALIERALSHGAFTLDAIDERLKLLVKSDPPAAQSLFARLLVFYPSAARLDDERYMLAAAGQIGAVNLSLEIEAIEKVRTSHGSTGKPEKPAASPVTPKPPDSADDTVPPDDPALTFSEALARARKIDRDLTRSAVLIELSRRENTSPRQQGMVADEAVSALAKMPPNDDRMVGLSMLTRDFAKRHDQIHARKAARLLADTFAVLCGCQNAICDTLKGREHCADNIKEFAEYLDEENIPPEDLGIENVSLDARMLLIELARLVHFKA